MNSEATANTTSTIEIAVELQRLPEILDGLQQIKVAAQEAAAAVASIGAPATAMQGIELVADQTPALILTELRGLRAELEADRAERQAVGIRVFQSV